MAIIAKHRGFTVQCVRELKDGAHIATKDLHNLRICTETAKQFPAHLDLGAPSDAAPAVAPEVV